MYKYSVGQLFWKLALALVLALQCYCGDYTEVQTSLKTLVSKKTAIWRLKKSQ